MIQAEFEREVAQTTGESLTVDWDQVQDREPLRYAPRRRPVRRQLAA